MASLDKWDEYTQAKEKMFFHTDTAESPWIVIKSDFDSLPMPKARGF
jgi:polyphosphate kinase 2 (PPK2 family)